MGYDSYHEGEYPSEDGRPVARQGGRSEFGQKRATSLRFFAIFSDFLHSAKCAVTT